MGTNENLRKAHERKNDEFYTQMDDVEGEMNSYLDYNPDIFRGKTVLCPCDDPTWSNFTRYFVKNFSRLGLKRLVSTCFSKDGKGKILDVEEGKERESWRYLEGDGDFRSEEVTKLRDESDFVVTNPPFSLFREFIAWIMAGKKKFSVIGNMNAIGYKEIFPLLKENKIRGGCRCPMTFRKPDGVEVFFGIVCWFTNIETGRMHKPLSLMTMADNLKYNKKLQKKLLDTFGAVEYPHYDNYDAIEVPMTECIPSDYAGVMGVPITFMDKYYPEQFEIVGLDRYTVPKEFLVGGRVSINGRPTYARILIRHRKKN